MYKEVQISTMTGAHGVAEVISRQKSPIVFGMPGGNTLHIFDGLKDRAEDVECVLVREESLATMMAEAYGRLTDRGPAVVMAQGAWILGVGAIGLIEAKLGASPMVIFADTSEGGTFSHHGPYQTGAGGYGSYELVDAFRAVTKQTFYAEGPLQAVQMAQLAFKHAVAGEPGPVAVVFSGRALTDELTEDERRRIYFDASYGSPSPSADESSLRAAATAISSAAAPVLVVGNGSRSAADVVAAFAEQWDIPVAASTSGKGVLSETSPLSAGVMGTFGHDTANTLVGQADVIIAVGTKLSSTDTMEANPGLIDPRRQTIIQIDVEPLNLNWTTPSEIPILGDAADALTRLSGLVTGTSGDGRSRVATARETDGWFGNIPESAEGVVSPRRLARILSELLPAESTITCDAGENRIFMLHDFQTSGQVFIGPNGAGGMGYAVPAAIAATYADPDRVAVAVLGDGGLGMSIHGLMTAVENRRTLLVIVMDNRALGWVFHGQGDRGFLYELQTFDYDALAASLGCTGSTARTEAELREAVTSALGRDGVSVIVVKTGLEESYKTITSALGSSPAGGVKDSHEL